nr:MAG TPA: hypothetical protein [Caudoviricetes sp.]
MHRFYWLVVPLTRLQANLQFSLVKAQKNQLRWFAA